MHFPPTLAGNRCTSPCVTCTIHAIQVFIALTLFATSVAGQPVISGFSPTSGPVGTTVTISGSGFSPTAASNIVFFGTVRAVVSTASAGSLTVTVPMGATYQPISVAVTGLTGYSAAPFIVTFPGGHAFKQGPTENQYVFGPETDYTTGLNTNGIAAADFDGDGKVDLATANNFNTTGQPGTLSVFQNLGTPGRINFAAKQDLNMGGMAFCVAAGDLDGDGKPDLVAASIDSQSLYVFKNTSTPGNISFSLLRTYATGMNVYAIVMADLDGDGKPELVTANYLSGTFSVFRNTTSGGKMAFAAKADVSTGLGPRGIAVADFNGDGKVDLAIANALSNTVQVFANTSASGQITFSAALTYNVGSGPYAVAAGDLDQDGKPDLAVANNGAMTLSIFRNSSSAGSLSFAAKTDYPANAVLSGICIGDLNGDGKPDVTVVCANTDLYQNLSTPGNIVLAPSVSLWAVNETNQGVLADFDGDGKSDLALTNLYAKASVLRNIDNEPSVQSFSPSSAAAGATIALTGVNFTGATTVRFGGVAAASFTVTNDSNLVAVVGSGISGDVSVVGPYGTGLKSGFVFQGPPTITSLAPAAAGVGVTVTITGTNFVGATAVSFGGVPAASFTVSSPTTIAALVGSGASGQVSVTTPYGTGSLSGFTLIPPPEIDAVSPDTAIMSSIVTITGLNLQSTTGISFGGVPATSFSVISPTTIQAVLGNGASGEVVVTADGGTDSLAGFVFLPPPSITAVSPDSGSTGTRIVLTGNQFQNASAVTFGGVPAASFFYQSPTQLVAIPAAGASGAIVVTTPYGSGEWAGFTFVSTPRLTSFVPVSGTTGTVVTITGSHLDSITSVSFGGVPAQSFALVSPDTLTAVVGAGGSGNVTVSMPYDSASQGGFFFAGAPVIGSISPADVGPGSTVTITGSNLTATQSVLLGGVAASSFTVVNASTIIATVGGTAINDSIVVSNLYGTTSAGGFAFDNLRPSISSISPISGVAGARVTISGANFNPTAVSNIIFFGAVRAVPASATANSITVNVPIGATFGPVSVTTGALTAYSGQFFLPVFSGSSPAFTDTSFQVSSFEISVDNGDYVALSDLNNDGKIDMLISNNDVAGPAISTDKNISTPGDVEFPEPVFVFPIATDPFSVAVADFDGDGKPDIVAANQYFNTVSVSGNASPDGSYFTFPNTVTCATGQQPLIVAVADIDGDGKPDIVVTNNSSGTISVLLNTSAPGSISFAPKQDFNTPGGPFGVAVGDLNGDGRPDIAIACSSNVVSVFINQSLPGAVRLGSRMDISTGSLLTGIAIGDLDGDGKADLAVTGQYSGLIILRNTGSNGSLSFAAPYSVVSEESAYEGSVVAIGDLDGDGKPDVVVGNGRNSTMSLYKNMSVVGIPYLAAAKEIASSYNVNGVGIGDIDGDGKPDIVTSNAMDIADVFRNVTPAAVIAAPTISSFAPDSAFTGTPVTITGTNLDRVVSVSFGGVPAASFVINSESSITAVVGGGGTGVVTVSNAADTGSLGGFVYLQRPAPSVVSFTPTSAKTGDTVIITGTNFTGVAAVFFGDEPAAGFTVRSTTSIAAAVGTGASGSVTVVTTGGSASLGGFVFTGTRSPIITSFSPASGGQGTTVTIRGSGFTGASAVSFGGTSAASFTVVSDSVIRSMVGAGATGDVSVANDLGTGKLAGFTFAGGAADSLHAYPNPAHDAVTITFPSSAGTAQLLLVDSRGDVLKTILMPPGTTQEIIVLKGLATGIYHVEWISGGNKKTETVLVM